MKLSEIVHANSLDVKTSTIRSVRSSSSDATESDDEGCPAVGIRSCPLGDLEVLLSSLGLSLTKTLSSDRSPASTINGEYYQRCYAIEYPANEP
jgi:hypothetical protein